MYLATGILSKNDPKIQKDSICKLAKNTLNVALPKLHSKADRSLYIFSEDNFIRNAAKYIISLYLFEFFIQITILANCVVLTLESHLPQGDSTTLDKYLDQSELIFLIIFTNEAILKIIALGFIIGKNTYLRSPWNILDFVVICVGIIGSMIPGFDQRVVGALRALRPLKLIYNIKSLQIVMKSLFRALQPLLQIAILILFVILIYSIIGLEFYIGKFHYACFKDDFKKPYANGLPSNDQVCSPNNRTTSARLCQAGFTCRTYWKGPFYGTTNFDNVLFAMLTVFQCITMEGWTDILYVTNQATGVPWNYVYYVSLVLIGSFFMLNLVLGVLSGEFAKERERVEHRQEFLEERQRMILEEEVNGYLDWIETAEEESENVFRARHGTQKIRNIENKGNIEQLNPDKDILKTLRKEGRQCHNCLAKGCLSCYPMVSIIRSQTRSLLKSQAFYWIIMILVTLNILIVSTEYYNQPAWLDKFQSVSEYVFLGLFFYEILLKMFVLGFRKYFHSKFNIFDFTIVFTSAFEIIWQCIRPDVSFGISALRTIRIIRIFKVTRYWSGMRLLVNSLFNSLRSIFSLLLLLFLFLFISAILGMQLFGGNYAFDEGRPSLNFDSFFNAMLTVFQILTGENWNESMYNGIRSQTTKTTTYPMLYAIYFLFLIIFGNYILLNIFLAIVVDNLGNVQEAAEKELEFEEGKDNLKSIFRKDITVPPLMILPMEDESLDKEYRFKTINEELESTFNPYKNKLCFSRTKLGLPLSPYSSLFIFSPTNLIRRIIHFIVNLEHFESFITLIILASCISLASEDVVNQQASINGYLKYSDYVISGIFFVECVFKIIDLGLILNPKAYLRSIWNFADLSVVVFFILFYSLSTSRNILKSLRVIRILRPLKTVQRIKKLKDVFETVVQSIKNVFNILIVHWLFQIIFAAMAVQLFSGRFFYCNDYNKRTYDTCRGYFIDYKDSMEAFVTRRVWQRYCFHYDNVIDALVTLFTVTTSEGWLTVLRHSMDSTYVNMGPIFNFRPETALFYITFFIIFPFFFVNIFVALIIITFQKEGHKFVSEHGLDRNQKFCIDFVITAKPRFRYVPSNKQSLRYRIWSLVESPPFEIFILIMILVNSVVLIMKYYRREQDLSPSFTDDRLLEMTQYHTYHEALYLLNISFVIIFSLECILKMTAFNPKNYFMNSWNVFDFIIVIGSITDCLMTNIRTEGSVKYVPNISVLRLFRAARLAKLLVHIYGIKIIMWTFLQSFKSLPYVILLIFMLFYIYAVMGMQLFGNVIVKADTPITIYNNFQTFSSSMLLLFRCATGENWQEIMVACEGGQECQECGRPYCAQASCGSDISYLYFLSFSFLTTFLMLNLFIAVLMENFDYLTRDVSIMGPHHLDQYIEKWSHYDPLATGQVDYTDIYDLLINIEPPVGFGKKCPYRIAYKKLIKMNMPVKEGKINFTTTLMALIREALKIKKYPAAQSDILDMELRWSISEIWPDFAKKSINLLVPSVEELTYPNLTIGKIYACMLIYENWRVFKAATRGRRHRIFETTGPTNTKRIYESSNGRSSDTQDIEDDDSTSHQKILRTLDINNLNNNNPLY